VSESLNYDRLCGNLYSLSTLQTIIRVCSRSHHSIACLDIGPLGDSYTTLRSGCDQSALIRRISTRMALLFLTISQSESVLPNKSVRSGFYCGNTDASKRADTGSNLRYARLLRGSAGAGCGCNLQRLFAPTLLRRVTEYPTLISNTHKSRFNPLTEVFLF